MGRFPRFDPAPNTHSQADRAPRVEILERPQWRTSVRKQKPTGDICSPRRIQPVDATVWLNISASVWKPRVFLGLWFNCLATALSLACESLEMSMPFGTYCLSRPFVFSLLPRYQGLCGLQK
jgi:hypothetical protein